MSERLRVELLHEPIELDQNLLGLVAPGQKIGLPIVESPPAIFEGFARRDLDHTIEQLVRRHIGDGEPVLDEKVDALDALLDGTLAWMVAFEV